MGPLFLLVSLLAPDSLPASAPDVHDLMIKSLAAGDRNAARLRGYVSAKRVDEKQIETDGSVRSETVKAYDYVLVEGVMVRKLIERDGKPLPPSEASKEDDRVRRIAAARNRDTSSDKAKRVAEEEKKLAKQRAFNKEILDAFNFRVAGEQTIDGRANWIVDAAPAPGYKPKDMRAQIFPHLKGRIWIDQRDLLWTKAEAEGADPISIGFGVVAKLEQGARLFFAQSRQPDGVWLSREWGVRAIARVALIKKIGVDQITTYSNFRKVPPGVDVVEDTASN